MFPFKKNTNDNNNNNNEDNQHNVIPKHIIIINLENNKNFYNIKELKDRYDDFTITIINNVKDAIKYFDEYNDSISKKIFEKINCFEIRNLYMKLFLLKQTGGISIKPTFNITNNDFTFYHLLNNECFLYNTNDKTFNLEICSVFPNNNCIHSSFKNLKDIMISFNYDYLNVNEFKNLETTLITNNILHNNSKILCGNLTNDKFTITLKNKKLGNNNKYTRVNQDFLQKINTYTLVNAHILQPNINKIQHNTKEINIHNLNITLFNGTPSICYDKNKYIYIKRWVSYQLNEQAVSTASKKSFSVNTIQHLDNNLNSLENEIQLEQHSELSNNFMNSKYLLDGIEDVRLFNFQDAIYCYGSVIKNQRIGVFISKLIVKDNDFTIEEKTMFIPNFHEKNCTEKNWTLINLKNVLKVIYIWYPITICNINNRKHKISLHEYKYNIPVFFKGVRGSTPGIRYKDELWFVLHKTKMLKNGTGNYFHFLAVFDLEMNFKRHSELFKFKNYQVEFCAGLLIEDTRFIITFSCLDNQSCLITLNHDYVNNELLWF